jgi:hypothetical protein
VSHCGTDIPDVKNILLFMDDICVYGRSQNEVQTRLNLLSSWAQNNCIDWNFDKCVVIPAYASYAPTITLDGHPLKLVKTARYLGILFSSSTDDSTTNSGFSFHDETKKLTSIMLSRMNWLKLLKSASLGLQVTAYRSLIQSRVSFSIIFLRRHLAEIEKAQQSALRLISSSLPGVPWARLYNLTSIPPTEALFWSIWPKIYSSWTMLPPDSPQRTSYEAWRLRGEPSYDETPLSYLRWSEGT